MAVGCRAFLSVILAVSLLSGCSSVPPVETPQIPTEPVFLQLAAVGDMMLGTDFPVDHLPVDDGANLLAAMHPQLSLIHI